MRHALLIAALALCALAPGAFAQEPGLAIWERGNCSLCHGSFAQGGIGMGAPVGPNLRETRLDRAGLIAKISCGTPGGGMPMNRTGAYERVACYGLPLGPAPEGTRRNTNLEEQEIHLLVDFLLRHVVGQMPVTRARCAVFMGGDPSHPGCASFR